MKSKNPIYPSRVEMESNFRNRVTADRYKNRKYLTTYSFYIFRKRMNVVYKSKKEELSHYIRKRGIRKLLKRKAVLV